MLRNKIAAFKTFFLIICFIFLAFFGASCSLRQLPPYQRIEEFIEDYPSIGQDDGTIESIVAPEVKDTGDQTGQDTSADVFDGSFISPGDTKKITLEISYEITAKGNTSKIEFRSSLPADYKYRQKVMNYSYAIQPTKVYSIDDNTYARFIINHPPEYFSIDIDIEMEIYDFDLTCALENRGKLAAEEMVPGNLEKYLKSEPNIEKDNQTIKDIASTFSATDNLGLVEEIYYFVLDSMTYYGYNPENIGAAEAYSAGGGDCTEYSDLFVALCRAKNIPARVVEGYVTDAARDELSLGHNWSEVYIKDLGWIPFDTIYDDNNGDSKSSSFNDLENIYIYTGFTRNDTELFDFHYYAYVYYGDNMEVKKKVSVR